MSVAPAITRLIIEEELEALALLATTYGWEIGQDLDNLTVSVKLCSSRDGEPYLLDVACHDYRALPPIFEFIDPETGERGTKRAYPDDSGNFFHSHPCICVQWNRKAYADLGGPHRDWQMSSWIVARPGTTTLGDMLAVVQRLINSERYRGRMA